MKDDDTVEMRPVTLGVTEGAVAAVDKGVNPGERVVVDGAEGLRPGARVALAARKGVS